MARVAGNKSYYTIGLLDDTGNPTKTTYHFPSVTSVLDVISKPSLMHWYYRTGIFGISKLMEKYGDKLPTDVESLFSLLKSEGQSPYAQRNEGGVRGKIVHADLEKLCKGRKVTKTANNEGLLNWWETRGLSKHDIIATETPLVSFTYQSAGTPDIIYRDPETDKVVLSDLKTGKHVAWTHFVQGEAYKRFWLDDESTQENINTVSVLHVRPIDDTFPKGWKELTAPEITFDSFVAALALYRALPVRWHAEDMDESEIV